LIAAAIAVLVALLGEVIAAATLYGVNAWVALFFVVALVAAIGTFLAVTPRKALTPAGAEVRIIFSGCGSTWRLPRRIASRCCRARPMLSGSLSRTRRLLRWWWWWRRRRGDAGVASGTLSS
jgi:hypothetical protein